MWRLVSLALAAGLFSCSESSGTGCSARPAEELIAVSEAAFKRFNNDRMFTSPIAELTPRASGFSYQDNIPIWVGTLKVIDKTGTTVASLIPMIECNGEVEFSVEWKKQTDGAIKSGLGE